MTIRSNRTQRSVALATALALLASLAVIPAANAQTSGDVSISAEVDALAAISFTLCDDAVANFGTNLNAEGQPSDSGSDTIVAFPGGHGVGAFYGWDPACTTQPKLFRVTSPLPWSGGVCLSQESGSSSLNDDGNDLRWSPYATGSIGNYSGIDPNTQLFQACGAGAPPDWVPVLCGCGTLGTHDVNASFYLQVDWNETAGTYSAVTTWSVTT
jgi:hypothetical protein